VREHRYEIDVAVNDDKDRTGLRADRGRSEREKIVVTGVQNVVAELSVKLLGYYLSGLAFGTSDDGNGACKVSISKHTYTVVAAHGG